MTFEQYWGAKTLVKRGLVSGYAGKRNNYFRVKEYDVRYDKVKKEWTCTCPFGSLWGKQEKDCRHIRAAKLYAEEHHETKNHAVEGSL